MLILALPVHSQSVNKSSFSELQILLTLLELWANPICCNSQSWASGLGLQLHSVSSLGQVIALRPLTFFQYTNL
jgi:hypothetical protein